MIWQGIWMPLGKIGREVLLEQATVDQIEAGQLSSVHESLAEWNFEENFAASKWRC